MAGPRIHPERTAEQAPAHTHITVERGLDVIGRWRARRAERARADLISARNRRVLAERLLRTAYLAVDRDSVRRRHDVLLHYRAAVVRTELLELAAALERSRAPDPDCIAALQALLATGADSPLYNRNIHVSELLATLDYVHSGL
jgi:hypothetical protein